MSVIDVKRRASASSRRRRPVVGVIGSGQTADPHCDAVGRLIASLGADLLTGGGRGVMEAVCRAFFNSPRHGIVIGIIPARVHGLEQIEDRTATEVAYAPPYGYPNEWVELPIYTHLPDSGEQGTLRSSRNHINVLTADALVAMPGREGTESEVWLAKQYGVPVMAYGEFTERVPHGIPHARTIDALREFLLQHVAAPK